MNPIENEAVVADILRKSKGGLELMDKRPDMSGIVARPGWKTWKVMCTLKRDKNKMKKNSPKMVQRRKEWAEKMKKESGEENKANSEGDEKDEKSVNITTLNETNEVDESMGDEPGSKHEKEPEAKNESKDPKPDPVNEPLSWDEQSLREKASSLGILYYDNFENVPEHLRKRIRSSCFPPTQEEAEKFHLERCMRCLPHDMDTGGFFIALFKKVAPVGVKARNKDKNVSSKDGDSAISSVEEPNEVTKPTPACTSKSENTENMDMDIDDTSQIDLKSKKGKERGRGKTQGNVGNSDFVPVPPNILPNLMNFYGLEANFPQDQIMCRECGEAKILYFITHAIKTKLIERGIQRITVINSGTKIFERNSKESEVRYRVNQEGIHMIAPYMQKRKLVANFQDFVQCLNSGAIYLSSFSSSFAEQMRQLSLGAFVVALEGFEDDYGKKMLMVMWRCRGEAVNCLVSKIETEGMKCKLRAIADLNNIEYNPKPPVDSKNDEEKQDDSDKKEKEEEGNPTKKEKILN